MQPSLPDKDFFSMGEVSKISQVPAHTLRYWESRVGTLRPSRLPGGHRRYSRQDLETVLSLKSLVTGRRMTLDGARRVLLEQRKGRGSPREEATRPGSGKMLKTLLEVRKELRSLVQELSR